MEKLIELIKAFIDNRLYLSAKGDLTITGRFAFFIFTWGDIWQTK